MPSHLLISITFLQPTCHARRGMEEAAGNEWPPSPLRLFQAMTAAAAARWAGEDGSTRSTLTAEAPLAALKWLENLCEVSPPIILAPRAVTGQAVLRYVPNNSADLLAAKWARGHSLATFEDRTRKIFRPTHLLEDTSVHYLWPLNDAHSADANRHMAIIAVAARSIVALGWGIDVAIGDARIIDDSEAERLTGERWTPGRVGTPGLRLPVCGTLDALIDRHAKFLDRLKGGVFTPVPPLRAFTTVTYFCASELPRRPFAAFILRPPQRDSGYAAFAQTRAALIAAMLRHAACMAAQSDIDDRPGAWRTKEWALRFIAGHGPAGSPKRRDKHDGYPRFSYLALPSIGHPHADGLIRRVLIAEPFGGDGRSARWICRRLAGAFLQAEDRNLVARLEAVDPDDVEFHRVFRLYTARSRAEASTIWTSITPVILPGYDDGKPAKRERLLRECLVHAGLDKACKCIEARPAAWWPGCAPYQAFHRPAYLRHLPALHVRICFHYPVAGPIALGAGRHCGLGVFAACKEGKE